jgi:hypothetical protein
MPWSSCAPLLLGFLRASLSLPRICLRRRSPCTQPWVPLRDAPVPARPCPLPASSTLIFFPRSDRCPPLLLARPCTRTGWITCPLLHPCQARLPARPWPCGRRCGSVVKPTSRPCCAPAPQRPCCAGRCAVSVGLLVVAWSWNLLSAVRVRMSGPALLFLVLDTSIHRRSPAAAPPLRVPSRCCAAPCHAVVLVPHCSPSPFPSPSSLPARCRVVAVEPRCPSRCSLLLASAPILGRRCQFASSRGGFALPSSPDIDLVVVDLDLCKDSAMPNTIHVTVVHLRVMYSNVANHAFACFDESSSFPL